MKKPSDLDKRAAKRFQILAQEGAYFSVTCRFRKVIRTDELVEHHYWTRGAKEFRKQFGNAPDYFAGAIEYLHLMTGWKYPYPELLVTIFSSKRRISGGLAILPPGPRNSKSGEIRICWSNGEFTTTVFHELVHLFKKGSKEDWVEQQALKLTMGI